MKRLKFLFGTLILASLVLAACQRGTVPEESLFATPTVSAFEGATQEPTAETAPESTPEAPATPDDSEAIVGTAPEDLATLEYADQAGSLIGEVPSPIVVTIMKDAAGNDGYYIGTNATASDVSISLGSIVGSTIGWPGAFPPPGPPEFANFIFPDGSSMPATCAETSQNESEYQFTCVASPKDAVVGNK